MKSVLLLFWSAKNWGWSGLYNKNLSCLCLRVICPNFKNNFHHMFLILRICICYLNNIETCFLLSILFVTLEARLKHFCNVFLFFLFLDGAPTSICHFFHLCDCQSVCLSTCRAPYLRSCASCDHSFWYTCVKWWYLQTFSFIKIFDFFGG